MNIRQPLNGEHSSSPRDTLAPVILAADGFHKPGHPSRLSNVLQTAANSLGYAATQHWDECLRVADAVSGGAGTIADTARRAGVEASTITERVADLRSLFGNKPIHSLIDTLLREQFLSYKVAPSSRPDIDPRLMTVLDATAQGTTDPDKQTRRELYDTLGCAPTMSAAIRRAYELELRVPFGLPSARLIGFHLPNLPVPLTYPAQPQAKNIEKRSWNITKMALAGNISPQPERQLLFTEFTPAELAFASLAALGCRNEEIDERTHYKAGTVRSVLGGLAQKTFKPRMAGKEETLNQLFESDTFFATGAPYLRPGHVVV